MKKVFALLLALALGFAMSVPVLAAADGKITVTNAVDGAEYKAYRIFDLTFDEMQGSYSYTVAPAWAAFVAQEAISGRGGYVTTEEKAGKTYVQWAKGTTQEEQAAAAAEFAALAKDWEQDPANAVSADAQVTASGGTAEFTGLPLGYYLVDTGVGALCILDSTDPEFTAADKSEAPTLDKTVQEGSEWVSENDANIGDLVQFRAQITVQKGAENYVMRDTMGKGLSFQSVLGVTLTPAATSVESDPIAAENYTVTPESSPSGVIGFSVAFENSYLDTLQPGDILTVYYSAEVTADAQIGTTAAPANKNEAYLEYGHNPEPIITTPSSTLTYVWELDINKFTGECQEQKPLAGASFQLHRDTPDGPLVEMVAAGGEGNYRVCTKDDSTAGHLHLDEITTGASGRLHIEGFDSGIYYLTETKAPDGYNQLKDPIKVEISKTGEISQDGQGCADGVIQIENKKGPEMPSTGGMGTMLFYLAGGVLAAAALVMVIRKKYSEDRRL